jgi:hypothetical protein
MIENEIERAAGISGTRRFRYLIDIVVLVAVTFLLDAVLGAFIRVPINLETGFVLDAIGKMRSHPTRRPLQPDVGQCLAA